MRPQFLIQYNPNSSDCWLGIARRLKGWLEEKGEDEAVYGGLVEYTVFFASFFDAKKGLSSTGIPSGLSGKS